MKAAVLVFPGINRERDMARTLRLISGREPAMVWHADTELPPGTDLVVHPGRIFLWRLPAMRGNRGAQPDHGRGERLCCEGRAGPRASATDSRSLCEAGLLPGVLMRNENLRFICRDVYLRVERSDTPFTRGYNAGQVVRVPVAHGEGNYIADGETIARLEGEGRVLFRYSSPDGMIDPNWNHNGCHQRDRRHSQRAGQCARHDAASGKSRRSRDRPDRRARVICGARRGIGARGIIVIPNDVRITPELDRRARPQAGRIRPDPEAHRPRAVAHRARHFLGDVE